MARDPDPPCPRNTTTREGLTDTADRPDSAAGRQRVDLLVEHWSDIPPEFRERLGLKPGLVRE
jgi:hypothetical protein